MEGRTLLSKLVDQRSWPSSMGDTTPWASNSILHYMQYLLPNPDCQLIEFHQVFTMDPRRLQMLVQEPISQFLRRKELIYHWSPSICFHFYVDTNNHLHLVLLVSYNFEEHSSLLPRTNSIQPNANKTQDRRSACLD